MSDADVVLPQVLQLYGRQAFAIDSGNGPEWAATFTEDGVFASPSYPAPVRGRAELTEFACRFPEATPGGRHVMTNTHVTDIAPDSATVRSTLLVLGDDGGAPCVLRVVTAEDSIDLSSGRPLVRHRTIRLA